MSLIDTIKVEKNQSLIDSQPPISEPQVISVSEEDIKKNNEERGFSDAGVIHYQQRFLDPRRFKVFSLAAALNLDGSSGDYEDPYIRRLVDAVFGGAELCLWGDGDLDQNAEFADLQAESLKNFNDSLVAQNPVGGEIIQTDRVPSDAPSPLIGTGAPEILGPWLFSRPDLSVASMTYYNGQNTPKYATGAVDVGETINYEGNDRDKISYASEGQVFSSLYYLPSGALAVISYDVSENGTREFVVVAPKREAGYEEVILAIDSRYPHGHGSHEVEVSEGNEGPEGKMRKGEKYLSQLRDERPDALGHRIEISKGKPISDAEPVGDGLVTARDTSVYGGPGGILMGPSVSSRSDGAAVAQSYVESLDESRQKVGPTTNHGEGHEGYNQPNENEEDQEEQAY